MKNCRSMVGVAAGLILPAFSGRAAEWTPTSGSNWITDANWTPTGAPNAAGAVATYTGASTASTSVSSASPVLVGTISKGGASDVLWNITPTTGLTLNQDGAGAGYATIGNSNTSGGNLNQLAFLNPSTSLILQDDLLVTNTGSSSQATGAISIASVISGTGNVTFSSVTNTVTNSSTYAGAVRLYGNTANTFTGSVVVQNGALVFTKSAAFGNAANTVTLGAAGAGSATMVAVPYSSPSAVTVANNVVVANGSGGTLVLGSAFTDGTSQTSYTGTLTLNGNLSFRSDNSAAAPTLLSGAISGAGNLTKIGSGVGTLGNAANTFTGITKVSEGTLNLGHVNAIKSSRFDVTGAGTVGFSVAGSNTYTLGGLVNHAGIAGMTIAAGTNSLTLDSAASSAVTIATGTDFASSSAIAVTAAAFTLGGNLTITFSNQLDEGTYSYHIVGGSTAGAFTSVSIDSSYTAILNAGNGYAANSGGNSFSFDNATGVLAVTAIPEPASVGMVMAALVGTITAARCRAKRLAAEV